MFVIIWLLSIFFYLLVARFIIDWILVFARNYRPSGLVAVLFEVVFSVTDPPLKFLRRFIPPLRMGNFSLDLSFIVLIIGVQILIGQLAQL